MGDCDKEQSRYAAIVKYFKEVLDKSGYEGEKVTLKSDQEVSIVALKRAVAAARSGEAAPIESPVRSSQSNGRMEGAVGIWQGQVRTIKHYTESQLGKRIQVDGVIYSWLVAFCADSMNKYKTGPDGRTAYENITNHKCRQIVVGFGEVVDYILEPAKGHMHKADSRVGKGVLLGYDRRSTEYIIGTGDGVYKCRTVRRRAKENSCDAELIDAIKMSYDEYILEGAKTTPAVTFARPAAVEPEPPVPMRGRDFVPRRLYTKASDYIAHGYTQGCRGCEWLQNKLGTRTGHTEECRTRIEKAVSESAEADRVSKVHERIDHYATQVAAEDPRVEEREGDPREEDATAAVPVPEVAEDEQMVGPEEFQIGSPEKAGRDSGDQELDDGPTTHSERRVRTPVRAPPTKQKESVHNEEPDTKRIIIDDLSEDVDERMADMGAIAAKQEDEWIVCVRPSWAKTCTKSTPMRGPSSPSIASLRST